MWSTFLFVWSHETIISEITDHEPPAFRQRSRLLSLTKRTISAQSIHHSDSCNSSAPWSALANEERHRFMNELRPPNAIGNPWYRMTDLGGTLINVTEPIITGESQHDVALHACVSLERCWTGLRFLFIELMIQVRFRLFWDNIRSNFEKSVAILTEYSLAVWGVCENIPIDNYFEKKIVDRHFLGNT